MAGSYYAAGHIDDPAALSSVADLFGEWNPGCGLGCGRQNGESEWAVAGGGRVCWIQDGRGEVFVPEGYRTKEGDGEPLPHDYEPEPAPPEWIEGVRLAATRAQCFQGDLRAAVERLCSRLRGARYTGDAANELWTWIEHGGTPPDADFAAFIALFERIYDRVGFSVKTRSGWEPVQPGDQILTGAAPLRVRGDFRYWCIETPRPMDHISALRRLRYLKDTAGGCNFQFDAFRRMSLTWYAGRGITPGNPDGVNQVNSHFVNIPAETSRAHYHPRVAIGGGKPQGEFYFVLDPAAYNLSAYGRQAALALWPDVADPREFTLVPLRPGSVAYITPGTAHRGIDVFANVVVLPGYKPKNQFFVTTRSS